jgi:hypothetical protein
MFVQYSHDFDEQGDVIVVNRTYQVEQKAFPLLA